MDNRKPKFVVAGTVVGIAVFALWLYTAGKAQPAESIDKSVSDRAALDQGSAFKVVTNNPATTPPSNGPGSFPVPNLGSENNFEISEEKILATLEAVSSGACDTFPKNRISVGNDHCDPRVISYVANIDCAEIPTPEENELERQAALLTEQLPTDSQEEYYERSNRIRSAYSEHLGVMARKKEACTRFKDYSPDIDQANHLLELAARLGDTKALDGYALLATVTAKRNDGMQDSTGFVLPLAADEETAANIRGVLTDYAELNAVSAYRQLAAFELSRAPSLQLGNQGAFEGDSAEYQRRLEAVTRYTELALGAKMEGGASTMETDFIEQLATTLGLNQSGQETAE